MNISRKWLSDYVALTCDDAALCRKLTMAGIEVEKVETVSVVPAGVVAAKILSREVHPNSDHLSVCQVFDGRENLQIVCGAPNCDAGQIVPLAPVGTVFSTPEGEFKDIAHPINPEARAMISDLVLKAYQEQLEQDQE